MPPGRFFWLACLLLGDSCRPGGYAIQYVVRFLARPSASIAINNWSECQPINDLDVDVGSTNVAWSTPFKSVTAR